MTTVDDSAKNERGADTVAFEQGSEPITDGRTMRDLLVDAFETYAENAALDDGNDALTYRDLERSSRALAADLQREGMGPNGIVAIVADRSVMLAVAIVGVLLSAGAYLPVDPTWPRARIAQVMNDARPAVILCDDPASVEDMLGGAEDHCPVMGLSRWAGSTAPEAVKPDAQNTPSELDLAYVIYTSGSTGIPKGAGVPHRGIVNRLRWMQEQFPIGPGDCVLQKTPYTFDVSVWEFLWPLFTGARLFLAEPGGHRDPAYLAETIRRERVTIVHFVPSMLDLFLAEVELDSLPSLRHVIASGEALSTALANRFTSTHDAALHNLYGPTEASIDVSFWTCERPERGRSVPIGRPIRGVRLTVRHESGRRARVGEIGELYIGGVCLAREYINRPELTAKSFVSGIDGTQERYYRTGDLARWTQEGLLEYHGRTDHQVKLHGQRIELGEIEAVAAEHPAVGMAVAVVHPDPRGLPRLVLYASPDLDERTLDELRRHLSHRLPQSYLPSLIISLDRLPLTASGKCDRSALPEPTQNGRGRAAGRRAAVRR
jgi:amino acid adenylation domain-containing protein